MFVNLLGHVLAAANIQLNLPINNFTLEICKTEHMCLSVYLFYEHKVLFGLLTINLQFALRL